MLELLKGLFGRGILSAECLLLPFDLCHPCGGIIKYLFFVVVVLTFRRLELIEQRINAIKNAPSDELANTDDLKPGEPPSVNILLWSLGIAALIGIAAYSSGDNTLYTGLIFPLIGVLGYFTVLQNHDQDTGKYEKACRDARAAQKKARAAQGRARSLGAVEIKELESQLREMKTDIESN